MRHILIFLLISLLLNPLILGVSRALSFFPYASELDRHFFSVDGAGDGVVLFGAGGSCTLSVGAGLLRIDFAMGVHLLIHICLLLLVASSLQNLAASMTCSMESKGAFAWMIQATATYGSLDDDDGHR